MKRKYDPDAVMTTLKPTSVLLSEVLVAHYNQLRNRIASRLGSTDLAGAALHETWIRLASGPDLGAVIDPNAYIYRAALNTASNMSAQRRRVLGAVEIDRILHIADPAPGPEQIAIGRSELAALRRLLKGLTSRQRHIFVESFSGKATHSELAQHYGVTVRTVQIELRQAILWCAERMDQNNRSAPVRLRVSRR